MFGADDETMKRFSMLRPLHQAALKAISSVEPVFHDHAAPPVVHAAGSAPVAAPASATEAPSSSAASHPEPVHEFAPFAQPAPAPSEHAQSESPASAATPKQANGKHRMEQHGEEPAAKKSKPTPSTPVGARVPSSPFKRGSFGKVQPYISKTPKNA